MTVGLALLRRLVAGLLAAAAFGLLAPAARAEDGAPPPPRPTTTSALERLTPEELAVIRRRVPGWDQLDAAARERIAANVLRLRGLSGEQRARFLERVTKLDRAGPVAAASFARNVRDFRTLTPEQQAALVRAHLVARAVALSMAERLPAESRALLAEEPSAGGLPFAQRLQAAACVGAAWRHRAVTAILEDLPLGDEPSAVGSPARLAQYRELRDQVRAGGGAAAPEALRRRFAHMVFDDRLAAARVRFDKASGPKAAESPANLAALGRALREPFPRAYDAVLADLVTATASGREGLLRFCEQFAPERPPVRPSLQWELVAEIEKRRHALSGDVLARADDLESALFAAMKVPEARVAALRAARTPLERVRLLRDLLREYGLPVHR